MTTKFVSLTLRAKENPNCKFISLAHILTEDFLKGCFWELKRDKASGIDGVSVKDYEVNLGENLTHGLMRGCWKHSLAVRQCSTLPK